MNARYRLHYAPDNASLVVRLAMDEAGLPFETVLVDRAARQHRSPAYRALNPAGLIPVLETPQGPVSETGAILLWLADTHGGPEPAPDDPERGAFLKWLFFTANTLHAELRLAFYPARFAGPGADAQRALLSTVRGRLDAHLALLDDLARAAPVWFRAAAPSGLCWYVACLIRWMALYPGDAPRWRPALRDTPHLRDMLAGLENRPAVLIAQRAEGLGPAPFTDPVHADPPEGSAT